LSIGFGFERLGLLTLNYPRTVGLVVLALTALFLAQLPRTSMDSDLLRVYADSGEYFDRYRQLQETFNLARKAVMGAEGAVDSILEELG